MKTALNDNTEAAHTNERVYLYDTTLRDGAQTQGIDFSLTDKQRISAELDALGIDYLECGWPGSNPLDDSFFKTLPTLTHAKAVAFGMTKRANLKPEHDPQLKALLDSAAPAVCLVGKTWDFHVDVALKIERSVNIELIRESVGYSAASREVLFDAEHFFDGFKANPSYTLACVDAAYQAGARWIVLRDTNGGTLPEEITAILNTITQHIPGTKLGIHCHNDTGQAVANSLAAVRAGVRQIQGTFNGLGERCGNANLATIIPTLMLKMGYPCGVLPAQLKQLTHIPRALDARLNRPSDRHAPYVGESAFAHKGGLHIAAVVKNPSCYEHIEPHAVGNTRKILVSDQAGRAALVERLEALNIPLPGDEGLLTALLARVKELEFAGYAFENAEASFVLLAQQHLHAAPQHFELRHYQITDSKHIKNGAVHTESQAVVSVAVNGALHTGEAQGNGPVAALDAALRRVLVPIYPVLATVALDDYKVRILTPDQGTEAITRVLIESRDAAGAVRSTVGVSGNILDASLKAIEDALRFALL